MSAQSFEDRLSDLREFYDQLQQLEERLGGKRTLGESDGRMTWPDRGVCFFFEPGEKRSTSGAGLRVVRVGTHALTPGSQSTLWQRLRKHRGTLRGQYPGGGNHRVSVFRLHVGTALIARHNLSGLGAETWGTGSSADQQTRADEYDLERRVSGHIREMPFLWLGIDDEAGPDSLREYVRRNVVGMLSNYTAHSRPIDPPSEDWLGRWSANEYVRNSGLWNVHHVGADYDPRFLIWLESAIESCSGQ